MGRGKRNDKYILKEERTNKGEFHYHVCWLGVVGRLMIIRLVRVSQVFYVSIAVHIERKELYSIR